jgi:hypothetical protein
MNDLKDFAVLQARVYEFLAQQDERTLQAITDGTAQLAVLGADGTRPPADSTETSNSLVSPASAMTPSDDPKQAARDLSRIASAEDRQIYLNATGLSVAGLKKVAKLRGLTRYSTLTRTKVIDLLAGRSPGVDAGPASVPRTPSPSTEGDQETASQEAAPPRSNGEAAAIASYLRETETEEEGAAYLQAQQLDRDGLLAVAAELQLTRVERLTQKDLRKRILKQAIGARRKYAGLRKW